jgi:hypothetical protein
MFHRLNRIVLTAGVSVAVIAAMAGPVSARAAAGFSASQEQIAATGPSPIRNPGTLPVPLVMTYTATTSDQDTCAGECDEDGFAEVGPLDFFSSVPYDESASSTISAQITLTHVNSDGELEGTGPVTEKPTFGSGGEFTPIDSSCLAPASVTLLGADPVTGTGTATLAVSKSGSGPATLDMGTGRDYVESVDVSIGNCVGGAYTYDTTIQDVQNDLAAVETSPSTTDTVVINPKWNGGGTYATETLSGTVPWPVSDPPQADDGSITVKETWTVGCPAGSAIGQRIACIAEAAVYGFPLPGWNGGRIPYLFGGGHSKAGPGPTSTPGPEGILDPNSGKLDCSGFTRWVYSLAYGSDVLGAGETGVQIKVKGVNPDKGATKAIGDLVFYLNDDGTPHHVGILVSPGWIANETQTGDDANFSKVEWNGEPSYYTYTKP